MTDEAVFVRDGDRYVATELGLGPWYPGALHGGAPAALIAHTLVESMPDPGLRLTRITYEFVRPVLAGPLSVSIETVRPGRRVTLLDAILRDGAGVEVMRARGLFVRPAAIAAGSDEPPPFPGPEDGRGQRLGAGRADVRHPRDGVALRAGQLRRGRSRDRVVSPARAADRRQSRCSASTASPPPATSATGSRSELDWARHSFINPDLTLYIERDPVDEWVALQSQMRVVPGSVVDRHERALGPTRPDRPGGSVAAGRRARPRPGGRRHFRRKALIRTS